ncbi:MAG: class I SAM-dependent methyltransferase [Candidatus Stahlbacteria bacterium]|nr:class I SAM-dependent methyltransferase [Candidatus Stahlbacteria bacterium]
MLTYKFPWAYELTFKIPPNLIFRKKSLNYLVKELQKVKNPKKILDIGCGSGMLTPILKKIYPKSEILGIDKSPQMIEFAKKKYSPIANFKTIDVLDTEDKYDLIVAFYSFQFIPLELGIKRIKKLLNTGGVCIIITPGKAPFSLVHRFLSSILLRVNYWLYSPADFYTVLQKDVVANPHVRLNKLQLKLISELEGNYILKVKSVKLKV